MAVYKRINIYRFVEVRMMRLPEELVKKTKKLFPEAEELHEAIERCDITLIMDCLNELTVLITNITNEWCLEAMKSNLEKGEDSVGLSLQAKLRDFKAA